MYGRILNAQHEIVRMFDVKPRCGEDMCDHCGAELACGLSEEDCLHPGGHTWVGYEGDDELIAYIDKEGEPT